MARFSVQAEDILRRAGWYPGRQVPDLVASWKSNLTGLSGFDMFPIAERALLEFGGLKINQRGPGVTCAREPFDFAPTLAANEDDRFGHFSVFLNTRLYPLAEAAQGHYFWAIGENESIYLLMDDIKLLGNNLDEALESLLIGIRSREL